MSVHVQGLLALAPEGVDAYDTTVPITTDDDGKIIPPSYPYLVIEAPTFHERPRLLDASERDVDDYFTLRVAGDCIEQARWAAGLCRLAFDGARPTVAGWSPLVKLEATSPFIVDRDIVLASNESPVFVADRYRYRATPAPLGS